MTLPPWFRKKLDDPCWLGQVRVSSPHCSTQQIDLGINVGLASASKAHHPIRVTLYLRPAVDYELRICVETER